MNEPIAVLAGTPVDTQMGAERLRQKGLTALTFPLSQTPREQTEFQLSPSEKKTAEARSVLEAAERRGCRRAFVYCNSLSAAVDFPALAKETGVRIVTPLDVYRDLAPRYRKLGVAAANAQGLAGIEKAMLAANPALEIQGVCSLSVVESIETGTDPAALVERHRLAEIAGWFSGCGMEALVLGCTHFPYFKAALSSRTSLPLIDPAEEMISLLLA